MPHVIYGTHQVANQQLRETLEAIATALARSIRVTSGDRTTVPHGGALHSLHLMNDAVDFHVVGLSDAQAFELLRHDRRQIFGNATGNNFRYQIIRHGPHTHTQGPHIHLGIAPPGDIRNRRGYMVEGLHPDQPYTVIENP